MNCEPWRGWSCALAIGIALALVANVPAAETPPEDGLKMNFRDASLDDVLDYLSAAAGFIIVRDVDIDGRIDVWSHQPLSKDEAVDLLNTVLHQKGYAAIRTNRTLRIVDRDDAVTHDLPVRTGSDPEQVPKNDEMITQIIPVRYVEAPQLLEDLGPLFAEYATVTSNESSNTIIITDTQTNVRRIMEIIQALDTSISAISEVQVFPLQYAEANDTATIINEVFEEDAPSRSSRSSGSSFMERMISMRGGGHGGDSGRGSRGGSRDGGSSNDSKARSAASTVVAVADERTNTLVVRAPDEMMVTIAQIVAELDANPAEDQKVFVFPLANADAENVAELLNELFEQASENTGGGGGGGFFSRMAGGGSSGGGGGRGGSSGGSSSSSAGFNGNVYVVADVDTNSLLVLTDSENYTRVVEILGELDRPLPQVLIKVLIAEVTHDDSLDIGAEFRAFGDKGTDQEDFAGTFFNLAGQTTGGMVKILDNNLDLTLRAIQEAGKLEVLSRPSILAVNNHEANITIGQEVPFVRNSRVTQNGETINTVEYEDIGIILSVTPHINADGVVTLDVYSEISTLTGEVVQTSDTVTQPIIAKRSAESRVVVPNHKTIIIGGLMEDQKTVTISKVPWLGDIPAIGKLFQRKTTDKSKTELLIFLTPHVIQEYDAVQALADSERATARLIPQAMGGGRFDEIMEDMQR